MNQILIVLSVSTAIKGWFYLNNLFGICEYFQTVPYLDHTNHITKFSLQRPLAEKLYLPLFVVRCSLSRPGNMVSYLHFMMF